MPTGADRTPFLVRLGVIVATSVVIGLVAHLSAAGTVRLGPLAVLAIFLALLVSGVVGAGSWLANRCSSARWSHLAEDVGAVLAMVAGQLLVHWSSTGSTVVVPAAAGVGHHLHGQPAAASALVTGAMPHLPGAAVGHARMLLAHCLAALVAAVCLRWLESALLGLARGARVAAEALSFALLWNVSTIVASLVLPQRRTARPRPRGVLATPVLRFLGAVVIRRGPPMARASF